ncbi:MULTISPECIES: homocysteine S-methyltransferase family protein [unclassified Agarivorans]|uniref:homocysteine S-methyltransferase family protein n=1 Tax=unclassified Agarivorans TaxID=2636026 RepID=UPI003D7DE768
MSQTSITILDGGMGRELAKRGAPFRQPEWSALAMIEAPDMVQQVHQAFIEVGSQVITTNSYALVPFHIGEQRFIEQGLELVQRSGEVARQAVEQARSICKVAGSIPPLFGSYRADLFCAEQVETVATPLIRGLAEYVDLWLLETQSLIEETQSVAQLIQQLSAEQKPIWVSFTLEDAEPTAEPCLRSGETVQAAVKAMFGLGIEAILFNCCQPEIIEAALQVAQAELAAHPEQSIRLGAYANAFPPQPKDATANDGLDELREDLSPSAYLGWAEKWQAQGASLIGGCCGIGPEHIAALAAHFSAPTSA